MGMINSEPRVVSGPIKEPLSLVEAQACCNIDTSDKRDDDLMSSFISAARAFLEEETSRTFHEKSLELALDCWPSGHIVLPRATPLIAITSIKYYESDWTSGAETTVSTSLYIADTYSTPGRVVLSYGESWPSFTKYPVAPIRIIYRAGIADASPATEAPDLVKQAMRFLVGHMWMNREAVIIGDRQTVAQVVPEYGLAWFIKAIGKVESAVF